ncbi:hypothetical protein [Streptomyces sp. DH-12]|uniref:hypothetical protein n=1 Tax=Streptomyces sp. DH-12 TaxID=2072509 RepID=UPI00105747D4|nr:hypothetical protein [Streptomyces sp. DH-12]
MPSADEILQKMRALQERREVAAGPLVEILAKRSRLLEQLAELDESYGKAYVDAEAAGWTATELAKLGADEPVKRPRKRSRSASKRTSGQTIATATAGNSPVGSIPSQDGSSPVHAAPTATSG